MPDFSEVLNGLTPEQTAAITGSRYVPGAPVATQPPMPAGQALASATSGLENYSSQVAGEITSEGENIATANEQAAKDSAVQAAEIDSIADKYSSEVEDTKRKRSALMESDTKADSVLEQKLIEPSRWQKVLSGIVKTIGALGAGAGSSDGAALSVAMGLVDEKINEAVIDQLKDKAAAKDQKGRNKDAFDVLRGKFEDDRLVASESVAIAKMGAAKELERYAYDQAAGESRIKALEAASKLQTDAFAQRIENARQLQKIEESRREGAMNRGAARANAAASIPLEQRGISENQLREIGSNPDHPYSVQAQNLISELDKKRQESAAVMPPVGSEFVDPIRYRDSPVKTKTEYVSRHEAVSSFVSTASELESLLRSHGINRLPMGGEVAGRISALSANLVAQNVATMPGTPGAMDEGLLSIVRSAIGDPSGILSNADNVIARMKATQKTVSNSLGESAKNLGIKPPKFGIDSAIVTDGFNGKGAKGAGANPADANSVYEYAKGRMD